MSSKPFIDFKFNLQLFGEKTEQPTAKKKEDARKKGQIVFSKDLNMAFTFLTALLAMKVFGGYIVGVLNNSLGFFMAFPVSTDNVFNPRDMATLLGRMMIDILSVTVPILLTIMVVGVILNYLQVGYLFTNETLKFKLDKLNPVNGMKQIFSLKSLVELAKNLAKIVILSFVAFSYLKDKLGLIIELMGMPPIQIGAILWDLMYNLSLRIAIVLIILGVLDLAYKLWQNNKDLMMSKQEIKEEYKQMEGNPQIKGKIREKQRQMAMSRMMQDVPKADVIITNPTHFAVAVKYDQSKYDAPYVVAKGQDLIAKQIRKVAEENQVPIVENKPLARELFASVKIGRTIPEHLFHAVAEVLAFVYKIKKK